MSDHMLHIVGATRTTNCSIIVGDRTALTSLQAALTDALQNGSGGTFLSTSDGEHHAVAVILCADMYPVYTTYGNETNPARSRRETVPINKLLNYRAALAKAHEMQAEIPE